MMCPRLAVECPFKSFNTPHTYVREGAKITILRLNTFNLKPITPSEKGIMRYPGKVRPLHGVQTLEIFFKTASFRKDALRKKIPYKVISLEVSRRKLVGILHPVI